MAKKYYLERYSLTHNSYVGNNESIELTAKGNIEQVYGLKYSLAEYSSLLNLEFSLKYDHLNLDFLKIVFQKIPVTDILTFIETSPSGRYARKIFVNNDK